MDDNHTELANHVYGDFLTENPAVAQSAFGAHRVVPDRWKGMSPEQLADIRRTQELQRKENMVGLLIVVSNACGVMQLYLVNLRFSQYAYNANYSLLYICRKNKTKVSAVD